MKNLLEKISRGHTLTIQEAENAMAQLHEGDMPLEKMAAFLAVLHTRGETIEELLGFFSYLKKHSLPLSLSKECKLIDNCGTGGDYSKTFNISTASALLLASSGITVAKHGGGAISSRSGSLDVLSALGVPALEDPTSIDASLKALHFSFLYAPYFNPILAKLRPLRQTLGIRTSFNLLAPLLNPLVLRGQVVGVYHPKWLIPVAKLLRQNGSDNVMVIHSRDGLDEFSIQSATHVAHLKKDQIICYEVEPEEFGLYPAPIESLRGGDATENANIIQSIFSDERGPRRDVVALNAAAGMVVAGVTSSLKDGFQCAQDCIEKGSAYDFLKKAKRFYEDRKHVS